MRPELERARTGILGGTFNPIHVGHLRGAEEVAEILGLEQVVFVPSSTPPHKGSQPGETLAPAAQRLDWVQRAVSDNPLFEVDTIEIERKGPSYLIETLQVYGERLRPVRPVFLLGQDAFREIETWREPAKLLSLAHFAVMTRPPDGSTSLRECLSSPLGDEFELAPDGRHAVHRSAATWIRLLEITALAISASEIRRRLREGRSVRYLLPESVRAAVVDSGIYAVRAGGRTP